MHVYFLPGERDRPRFLLFFGVVQVKMVSLVCEGIPKISVSTVGGDAFSTRLYWHDSTASSFTRVRCMTTSCCMTPQVFGSLKKSYTVPSRLNGHSREPHLISLGELEEELQLTHAGYGELGPVCESKVNPSRSASVESGGSAGVPQTCCACGKAFDSADVVVMFESSVFHVACFCCGQCGAEVDANQRFLVLGDGCPLCYDCSPACHACGEKITGSHIGVLNKDFHEGCLKCFQCDKVTGYMPHNEYSTVVHIHVAADSGNIDNPGNAYST